MNCIHIFVLVALLALASGDVYQREAKRLGTSRQQAVNGCFHDGRYFYERSLIPTVDSCINCKCEGGLVRCNMTLCPMYPTIQEGCHLSHDEAVCCPQLTCDESVAKKMAKVPAIQEATLLGCTYNDVEFGLGDFIPTSDPCQACYCIHNRTQCVHQNCALPESAREGCRPVYHHGVCCPIRYDCSEAQSSLPTFRPPFITEGCAVNNRFYDEGEAIPSGKSCEHCYCMKGEMICAMQKCDSPMAGCVPVLKEGQCCPERYECPNIDANMAGTKIATLNISYHGNLWNGQRLTSTTRGLEDDLASELRITTAPSVAVTSPLSVAPDTTLAPAAAAQKKQIGYPTVLPTQAVLGFNESVFNTSTFQKGLAGKNQSVSVTGGLQGLQTVANGRPETGQISDAEVTNKLGMEDLLKYNVLTTKVGKLPLSSTSEFFNSADTLGTRPPSSSTPATPDINQLTINILPHDQGIAVSQSHSSSAFSNSTSRDPDDRLITHVGGSQTLGIITSSSDQNDNTIQLNTKINVTASSPTLTDEGLKLSVNGIPVQPPGIATMVPSAGWNKLPTPPGNRTRKPVLPAPLDPTASDPIEGLIRFFASESVPSASPNPIAPVFPEESVPPSSPAAVEPIGPNDPELESPGELNSKMTMPFAYAHLTQMGLAVDPSGSDEVEGQLISNGNNAISNLLFKANISMPVDPESADQTDGASAFNSSQSTADVDRPVDPDVTANVEGQIHDYQNVSGEHQHESVDNSMQILTHAQSQTQESNSVKNMSMLMPFDPTGDADIEGVLGIQQMPANLSMISAVSFKKGQVPNPVDPVNSSEIEGAIRVSVPGENVRSGTKGGVLDGTPVDPHQSDTIEGAFVSKQGNSAESAVPDNRVTPKPSGLGLKNKVKVVKLPLQPVEPSAQDSVEGIWQLAMEQTGAGNRRSTTQPPATSAPQVIHTVAGQFALGGALINQKRTMTIGAENVTLSSSSPILGSTLISVRLNGSVPVPLMLALNSAKSTQPIILTPAERTTVAPLSNQGWGSNAGNKGWGQSGNKGWGATGSQESATNGNNQGQGFASGYKGWGSQGTSKQTSGNSAQGSSPLWIPRPLAKPVEPLHEDDFEGIMSPGATTARPTVKPTSKAPLQPIDPMPSDQFEGVNRNQNNQNKISVSYGQVHVGDNATLPTTTRGTSKVPILPARFTTKPSAFDRWPTTTTAASTTSTPAATSTTTSTTTSATTTTETTTSEPVTSTTTEDSTKQSTTTPPVPTNSVTEGTKSHSTSFRLSDGSMFNGSLHAVASNFPNGKPLTGIYENGCYFEGNYYRNYQAISTDDLVDPCLVRLCKDGIVFGPSEQRCPPPISGCFSTSIPGVCCPVYLCPNYLERNETSYTLTAAAGDQLNTEKTRLALAKFCRVGPRFLALNERVVHVMGIQCQTCTCKQKGIVCEPGCAQNILITTLAPPVQNPRRFQTVTTTPATTTPSTSPPITEPMGSRSCVIQKKKFHHGDEVTFNDPCHMCTCLDGLVICKMNRKACRSAKLLGALDSL